MIERKHSRGILKKKPKTSTLRTFCCFAMPNEMSRKRVEMLSEINTLLFAIEIRVL